MQNKKNGVPLHSQSKNIAYVNFKCTAEIAQLVEHNLAKVGVASSSLVFRSNEEAVHWTAFLFDTMTRTKRHHSPLSGVGGVNIVRDKSLARSAGSSLVFRSKSSGYRNVTAFLLYKLTTREDRFRKPIQARPTISVRRAKLSQKRYNFYL